LVEKQLRPPVPEIGNAKAYIWRVTPEGEMNLCAILRRDGFTDGPTLEAAAARSTKVGDDMSDPE